jgi:hexosaminidase
MKKNIFYFFLLFLFLFSLQNLQSQYIIPQPVKMDLLAGSFELNESTILSANSEEALADAKIFNEYLKNIYGFELKIEVNSPAKSNVIILEKVIRADIPPQSYEISMNNDCINISGEGIHYGLQTLKQLLFNKIDRGFLIPCVNILDYPRYSYRGMHLDVSRHFFPKEFIKKYIDYIAMYKMNYFHWHLTDDQGWRIEIKKYPKLTEVGAWRKGILTGKYKDKSRASDTTIYGGFYTQEDIKEIVQYATERHITIIPEIEMPGHSLAALSSYPEYACTKGPFEVAREWGVFEDVFCPKEETFKFLENVLSEVITLLPSTYIHIGGDEVPKDRWQKCQHCQELIIKEGLKDENELQSYFIRRIEKFLNSKNKTLLGWDEILEGGLAPNAVVMSWRGTEGGIEAAKQNHNVIMTPGGYCYFDHYQTDPRNEPIAIGGYTTVEKVYSFEPTPSELTLEQQYKILGAQGNVWTEYIVTPDNVEYMVFPRIAALSEVLWTPPEKKDYNNFKDRLRSHFTLLDKLKINYSKAIYDISVKYLPTDNKEGLAIELSAPFSNSEIHFTTNGKEPDTKSEKYSSPIILKKSSTLKASYFENGVKQGNTFEQEFKINKATGQNITLLNQPKKKYSVGGAFSLVDGVSGKLPWSGRDWLGFLGDDVNATIELKHEEEISKVIVDVLNAEQSWIYLPKEIEILISNDGVNFKSVKKVDWDYIKTFERNIEINFEKVKAKFVKVIAKNYGKIPKGSPGEGTDAWIFIDEISIN